ncbi:MAG: Do family serine endopeptidase [Rhizobiales bacterium]|nr:Do family serine endopeptidase [Hyphomicrobiales bacterium]
MMRGLRAAGVSVSMAIVAMVAALTAGGASAQERVVPDTENQLLLSYSPVVKRTAPAVVNVYVRARVRTFVSPFGDDPFFRQFFRNRPGFGVPRERVENSLGSGVIVSPDGLVVTNDHVIKGGGEAEIKVSLADRREFDARVILRDEQSDLAVLKIVGEAEERFPFLAFHDSDQVEVGDLVLAIGNPFGVGQTVTSGIVSALARTRVGSSDSQFFIQTDAAINPGNSGGALVDMAGRLVGINTAIFSRSGGSIGIGFAIPSNQVQLIVSTAVDGGTVKRPWFGGELAPVTRDLADALGLDRVSGAFVTAVLEQGPAAEGGLRAGDVIVSVDGRQVDDPRAFTYRFTTRGVGGSARVVIIRDGKQFELDVPLREAPPTAEGDVVLLRGDHPLEGVKAAELTPYLQQKYRLRATDGVVIVDVVAGSIAASYGLKTGDLIENVNRNPITDLSELEASLGERVARWRILIRRGDRRMSMVVPGRL